jgi:hypothetical protein
MERCWTLIDSIYPWLLLELRHLAAVATVAMAVVVDGTRVDFHCPLFDIHGNLLVSHHSGC